LRTIKAQVMSSIAHCFSVVWQNPDWNLLIRILT
jgi:hypothetical protein